MGWTHNIPQTAKNESWNPTSKSRTGRNNSMQNAADNKQNWYSAVFVE